MKGFGSIAVSRDVAENKWGESRDIGPLAMLMITKLVVKNAGRKKAQSIQEREEAGLTVVTATIRRGVGSPVPGAAHMESFLNIWKAKDARSGSSQADPKATCLDRSAKTMLG
jgi:hypothetical protein